MRLPVIALLGSLGVSLAGTVAAQPLATESAKLGEVPRERVFDAVIEAVNQSTVNAQTSGRVTELLFDVDDYVDKGEVLIRFRAKEQGARLEAAEASLREAQARLAQARKEYARIEEIYAEKLVAKTKMDEASADLSAARARLNAARARVDEAREGLEHTVVRAPFSGIVVERHVELGETASPGQPLMTGLSLDHLRAVVHLPQSMMPAVRRFDSGDLVLEDGKRVGVDELVIFPYADPATHTFKVRLELPQGIENLFPGMLVKAAFPVDREQALTVSAASVVRRSEVTGVYVVDDQGRVGLRHVRLGKTHGDRVRVLAGLEAGEQVALDPIQAGIALKRQRRANEAS